MSIYLPRASVRMKQASSALRHELRLKALMAKLPILTPVIASSAVDALTSQLWLKMLPFMLQRPNVTALMSELNLIPVQAKVLKKYFRPVVVFRDGVAARDGRGTLTDVIYVDNSRFYSCPI